MACVPRQIASVLKRDFGEVCADMRTIERALYGDERWPDKGCTPNMVLEYARMHDLGAAVIHNEQVIESIAGKSQCLPLPCTRAIATSTMIDPSAMHLQVAKRERTHIK